jgi:hypothetical protein
MKRIAVWLIVLIVLPFPVVAQDSKDAKDKKAAEKKRKPGFTISKETTYVTGPIDKDGYVDYETALNEKMRAGVTPENNANVLLVKAFGPHPDDADIPEAFFKWLQIAAPLEKGDYFVHFHKFATEKLKVDPNQGPSSLYDKLEQTMTRPWKAEEFPDIAAWLKLNEKPLAVAIEASKRPQYYYPLLASRKDGKSQGLITASVVGVQICRNVASALTSRAMLRVAEKKNDDAWQDLLAGHRLGRLVGRGGTLIEGLVGVALDNLASKADLGFIDGAKLDAKQAKKCLADVQALPPMPLMADKLNLAERFWFLETVMILDRDGVDYLDSISGGRQPNPWSGKFNKSGNIEWDTALRNSNQFYNRMQATMRLKERGMRDKQLNQLEMEVRARKASLTQPGELAKRILVAKSVADATGTMIGDIMICLLVPAVHKVQHAADRTEQVHSNLQLAFALTAYRSDNGKYPKTLDALAPKYLPTIPQDLFSGKALIYRPTDAGYLLYSVGINGQDEEGRSYDDDPRGDDLPVRMPLPKLPKK